jgi:hypothetical protein
MMRARRRGFVVAFAGASALVSITSVAHAQEECPLGSVEKTEGGQTWCEPTICDLDNQCPVGSICRPVALCVEVGVLEASPTAKTDAGQRLLVRQRCGLDKACPQRTTCSEKGRCITRAQADKAGLTAAPGTDGGGGAPTDGASKKKACGCHVPGTSGGELGGSALALLGAIAIGARRRARRS